ncbi:MAG: NAD(+) synthase [Selenomonadaceae bacterium]|nr:NAD(+) synthase [Selenomonadaceae bacterium]
MKIAYVQMEVTAAKPEVNAERILKFIDFAKERKSELVIFPAFCISGTFAGNNFEKKSFLDDCEFFSKKIVSASSDIKIIFGGIDKTFVAENGRIIFETASNKIFSSEFGCKENFCVKLSAEPFFLEKDFAVEKLPIECPLICVDSVGIQNCGKTFYTFDGMSRVCNSRGEIVEIAASHEQGINFIDLKEIDGLPAVKLPDTSETAKIYCALHYGVRKFLKQIGIEKVVIGISGGIDSAVAAALYTKILGAENVYLINMPSVFNSATTKNLSEQLAKNLGCKYFVVPIQESVDFTVKQLEGVGFEISNFVKENIQARDRSGRILAAVAASVGGVFTCNANKAETTVGYATLYGDEAGFFCALADLWKFQIYNLANYLNEKIYKREVIPQGIIDIVPSAELSNAQNVDEGKGDPLKYPYHDFLFRAFVEKNLTPEDILKFYAEKTLEKNIGCEIGLTEKYFSTAEDFILDLERWWKLFTGIAAAKRLQSPPVLAVTKYAFGSFNEVQNSFYLTAEYKKLRAELLQADK